MLRLHLRALLGGQLQVRVAYRRVPSPLLIDIHGHTRPPLSPVSKCSQTHAQHAMRFNQPPLHRTQHNDRLFEKRKRLLLASVLELDAHFDERQGGTLGIISVERRNADGVDDFLALARERMEVAEVQRDERRGWFIYELRRKRRKAEGE